MRRREWGDLPVYCVVGGVFEAWSGIAAVDEQLYITIACLVSEPLPVIPNRPQLQSIEDVMGGVTRVCLGNYHMFLHTSLQRQQLFRSVMSHSTGL
jgi:hypothetical protein